MDELRCAKCGKVLTLGIFDHETGTFFCPACVDKTLEGMECTKSESQKPKTE